jgi:hypothetical protein
MFWLVRNRKSGIVHRAVKEGGHDMEIMMTSCGLWIRWDQPHPKWDRAPWRSITDSINITCEKCRAK